jgi:hypothetical protein
MSSSLISCSATLFLKLHRGDIFPILSQKAPSTSAQIQLFSHLHNITGPLKQCAQLLKSFTSHLAMDIPDPPETIHDIEYTSPLLFPSNFSEKERICYNLVNLAHFESTARQQWMRTHLSQIVQYSQSLEVLIQTKSTITSGNKQNHRARGAIASLKTAKDRAVQAYRRHYSKVLALGQGYLQSQFQPLTDDDLKRKRDHIGSRQPGLNAEPESWVFNTFHSVPDVTQSSEWMNEGMLSKLC